MTEHIAGVGYPYRIGVISDTHGVVMPAVHERFAEVALIIHAGDIGNDDVLIELEAIAPVAAVSGNVDGIPQAGRRPQTRQLETPAGRIAVTHGHLQSAPAGNGVRLAEYFRAFSPDIIIFGHSHIPFYGEINVHDGEAPRLVRLFNPGSAGRANFGRKPSLGLITLDVAGADPRFEHFQLA